MYSMGHYTLYYNSKRGPLHSHSMNQKARQQGQMRAWVVKLKVPTDYSTGHAIQCAYKIAAGAAFVSVPGPSAQARLMGRSVCEERKRLSRC